MISRGIYLYNKAISGTPEEELVKDPKWFSMEEMRSLKFAQRVFRSIERIYENKRLELENPHTI